MPNAIKWEAALTDRGSLLTTELNGLTAGTYTVLGAELDNSTNLDIYGWLRLEVDFVTAPTAGDYVTIHLVRALDGTNYERTPVATTNISLHTVVAIIPIDASNAALKHDYGPIILPPTKLKAVLINNTAQAFPATGSVLDLYTGNEELQ